MKHSCKNVNLLRYIHHFDNSITSWVGLKFPNNEVNDINNFACKVVQKEFKFVCNVACLKKEDKVQTTLENQIVLMKKLKTQSPTKPFLSSIT